MNHLGPSLRRRRYRSWTGWRLFAGVALSLLLNALVLWLIDQDWTKLKAFPTEGPRSVAMAPLSPQSWAANREITDGSKPAPPPQAPPQRPVPAQRQQQAKTQPQQQVPAEAQARQEQPPPPQLPGQVVDVAPSSKNEPPKDTRFLAESNNTVEKETISRFRRLDYEKAAPMPTQNRQKSTSPGPKAEPQASRAPDSGKVGGDTRKAGAPGRMPDSTAIPSPDKLALVVSPDGQIVSKQQPVDPGSQRKKSPLEELGEGGQGGDGASTPGASGGRPILTPSSAFYDQLTAAPAPDHVEGVDVGDATFLNTREWKYAGFFNRVKQNVAEVWNPIDAVRSRDPSGSRYLTKDRTTILSVTLNAQGGITDIKVARTSGLDFLDRTAIDAFEKAQPFVNPPPGLADARGDIRFTFGFHLSTGGGGFKFFRGPGQP